MGAQRESPLYSIAQKKRFAKMSKTKKSERARHQRVVGWSRYTPEERSIIMKERRAKGIANKKKSV